MCALVLPQESLLTWRAPISQSAAPPARLRRRIMTSKTSLLLLVSACGQLSRAIEDCCLTKTVRDAPAEVSELNGVYTLKGKENSRPDPACMDGCVYLRNDEEYCFVAKTVEEGATVDCEVPLCLY